MLRFFGLRSRASVHVLAVGLGNPGGKYAGTRHNIGFRWIDAIAGEDARWRRKYQGEFTQARLEARSVGLLRPTTFMNRSGRAVQAAMAGLKLKPESIWVAHDDLDLPFGTIKLKVNGGHGGNNGVRSIIESIGKVSIRRIRFGIGHPGKGADVVRYVLAPFSETEERALPKVLNQATDAFCLALREDFERATQWLHSKGPVEVES